MNIEQMAKLGTLIPAYLDDCRTQKRLDEKTLKAYRIDLEQLQQKLPDINVCEIKPEMLASVFANWHETRKPKTVKRKIASIKAFFHYLEEKGFLEQNPFVKLHTRFREPKVLPRTIPEHNLERLLGVMYKDYQNVPTEREKSSVFQDIVIIEFLFGTGVRISELCMLQTEDINLVEGEVLIHGKGRKERIIQIPDEQLQQLLCKYRDMITQDEDGYFFRNHCGRPLRDQSVRQMIQKYCNKAGITQHITPHMFRHTFATSLLESDVNLRCIQELLGHSSIQTTEIYTHVSKAKQRQVLKEHHPRKSLNITF